MIHAPLTEQDKNMNTLHLIFDLLIYGIYMTNLDLVHILNFVLLRLKVLLETFYGVNIIYTSTFV